VYSAFLTLLPFLVAYEQSATHRVLRIQRELPADLPLRHAVLVATHNSYKPPVIPPPMWTRR